MKFAVVDIETTGGNSKYDRIIEVAAFVFDGNEIIDEYKSLINPNRNIPAFITGLTNITNAMTQSAPTFDEIANDFHQILEGCVFVAHNVNFDLGFLKNEFSRVNIIYNPKKLCTVRLSRKLIPGLRSYSLGKLSISLGIELDHRHRAFGDARATVEVLRENLLRDKNGFIQKSLKNTFKESVLPPHLNKSNYEELPQKTGVYYFLDAKGEVLYVGKANNIKKRISEHFTDGSKIKSIRMLWENISNISYELCGNELISLLFEANEIKRLWPPYNSSLKRASAGYGIFQYEDQKGYLRLSVQKLGKSFLKPIISFNSNQEAKSYLTDMVRNHQLCAKLSGLQKTPKACYDFEMNQCDGACIGLETTESYNERFGLAFKNSFENISLAILGEGREREEKSVIIIENGKYKGFGFFDQSEEIRSESELINYIDTYKAYPETESILNGFLSRKATEYQLIPFKENHQIMPLS